MRPPVSVTTPTTRAPPTFPPNHLSIPLQVLQPRLVPWATDAIRADSPPDRPAGHEQFMKDLADKLKVALGGQGRRPAGTTGKGSEFGRLLHVPAVPAGAAKDIVAYAQATELTLRAFE